MTTRTPLPAPPLHDAALWLIGAPAAALLAAYAWAKAPALSADAPDQIIAVILACALGALIAWNLLWSAIAHAAAAGRAPGALRRALAHLAGGPQEAEAAIRAAGIDPAERGERLDVTAFASLAEALAAAGALTAPAAQEVR